MHVSIASDSLETVKVIIIKLGMVTASDMLMHHILVVLTLTFIQGHTDVNYEIITVRLFSEVVQAIPITFAVTIVRLMVFFSPLFQMGEGGG